MRQRWLKQNAERLAREKEARRELKLQRDMLVAKMAADQAVGGGGDDTGGGEADDGAVAVSESIEPVEAATAGADGGDAPPAESEEAQAEA